MGDVSMPGTDSGPSEREGRVLVELQGIVKRFGDLLANDRIDVSLHAGVVHGLLGENGAGKSTLMSILYGLLRPDEGDIVIGGERVDIRSPRDAIDHGIGLVHQELMLVPNLTVIENVVAGTRASQLLDLKAATARVSEIARELGFTVDKPAARVRNLSVGEAQRIEILKAIYRGAKVLILDEPTSRLTPQEVTGLGRIIRTIRDSGGVVVLVTHKLEEVLELCDTVTVLRQGRKVASLDVADLRATEEAPAAVLANLMIGRPVLLAVDKPEVEAGPVALRLNDIDLDPADEGRPLRGVSFEVRQGEVLGIAGVAGNGQRELAEVILGLRRPSSGTMQLHGTDVTGKPPWVRAQLGLGCVPDDRKQAGTIPGMTVAENLTLRAMQRPPIKRWGLVVKQALLRAGARLMREYGVRGGTATAPISSLSGGNQQKAVLARELSVNPSVLLVLQPTAGLDVGAIEQVHRRLLASRSEGVAVLLVSNELSEILSLSDRVAVMSAGRMSTPRPVGEIDLEALGMAMAGVAGAESRGVTA